MIDHDDLKLVFTGSCVNANFIKSILEDNGVGVLVRDTLKESTLAGWVSGAPEDACRVFVSKEHLEAAEKLIAEYLKSNK